MMSVESLLNNVPYANLNRKSLGFISPKIIKWRFTDLILLALLVICYFFIYNIKPFHRQFSLYDATIQHPFKERETVNNIELFLYSTWIPLIVILVTALVLTSPKYRFYNTYVAALGLLLCVLITSNVTDVLKNLIGRHRPDFIARCQPDPSVRTEALVSIEVCTNTDLNLLEDGYRTTPSGHSSISFAGLVYLALFLMGQFQANDPRAGSWRALLFGGAPLMVATYIAMSRTEDYRHHFVDVIIGGLLGFFIGSWSYLRLFPWISDKRSFSNLLMIEEEKAEERAKRNDDNNDTVLEDV
ncbi:DPP1 [Candida oxycetoniae]|uniref:DPP1 n=1 Tax=Candida oxycetoniae TaxID=497107 RepID=A0AAI9X009_9ASCO|nr:DPP1 [Candida oxycetoniae]KAI3406445.1 DPP1 [Candida oxycetoniae]